MAQNLTNQIFTSDLLTLLLVTMTANRLNRLSLVVSKDGGLRIPRVIRGEAVVDETGIEMGKWLFS
jgi:hypothetical protein